MVDMVKAYSADRTVQNIDVANPDVFAGPQNLVVDLAADTPNQEIIPAPIGDHQIWVYAVFLWAGTAQQGTIRLKQSGGAPLTGTITLSNADGFWWPPSGNFAMPWLKLGTQQGLYADTATISIDGVVVYALVDAPPAS